MKQLEYISSKIYSKYIHFLPLNKKWKVEKKKIVFTNGCFDLIHRGHIEYLSKAAEKGDKLIIGLNTDESVKKIKGNSRPVLDQDSRAMVLAAFSFVDAVIFFPDDTPTNLIQAILPDVLIKGKDYSVSEIAGHDIVIKNGGSVEAIELTPGYSTTSLIEKIKNE